MRKQLLRVVRSGVLLILLCLFGGCPKPAPPAPQTQLTPPANVQFVDRAAEWGVAFQNENGEASGRFAILETLGGGIGVLDFDRDGQLDLWCIGGGGFRRDGTPVGKPGELFRRQGDGYRAVGAPARIRSAPHYQHGIAATDFDQDGFVDVLITGYGAVQLWHNAGDGTFDEVTHDTGLGLDVSWSSSAAWGDFNKDGHLDLYITHYVNWSKDNDPPCYTHGEKREVCSPLVFEGLSDTLFESDGAGHFIDRSREIGLVEGGKGMSALVADLDLDGDVDVYVGNDTSKNFLYENQNGRLAERGLMSGVSVSPAGAAYGSMGTDLGDFDLDGLPDLWVANFEDETFALFKNLGNLQFEYVSDKTKVSRIGQAYVGWGVVFGDWNLDGDEDVFVSNGHVVRNVHKAPIQQLPLLMDNIEGREFQNIAEKSGAYFRTAHPGRGSAAGDLDRDGDLDLVVSHINQPVAVLENQGTQGQRSLVVELIGTRSPRCPVGAFVRLITSGGSQIRQWRGGGSFASTSATDFVFGIPAGQNPLRLEVNWPSGLKEFVQLSHETRRVEVIEGAGDLTQ